MPKDDISDTISIEGYQAVRQLSKNGVAEVYLAHEEAQEEHEVVIKVFRSSYARQRTFHEYFSLEVEKIASLVHPHILPLLAYGVEEDFVYVVSPFVSTGTLADLRQRIGGRFSATQALPVVQQVCEAVSAIHAHQLVHGNIKPSNVFIAGNGRIILGDFGIVRGYDDAQQSLTRIGWGAAEYAAPEQSLGVLRPASDIYALGVLLFELLTGAVPFAGQTPVEVLLKHVRQNAPSMRISVASISDAVDAVVLRALQKRTEDRFATAQELSDAFQHAVMIAPVASPVARPASFLRSHQLKPLAARESAASVEPVTPPPVTQLSMQEQEQQTPALPEQLAAVDTALKSTRGILQEEICDTTIVRPRKSTSLESIEYTPEEEELALAADPPEWSPIAQGSTGREVGGIPLTATDYLEQKPVHEDAEDAPAESAAIPQGREQPAAWKRWLPMIILILLLLGLLAALCSAFFFPSGEARMTTPSGGLSWLSLLIV